MPRKIRQLEAELLAQGFVLLRRRGKGDHRRFEHPDHPDLVITLDGHSGDDAKPYQEKQIRQAIAAIAERRA
jgi:predicted RNA binding protein YcfA (HicA-like mRNA interferase family)